MKHLASFELLTALLLGASNYLGSCQDVPLKLNIAIVGTAAAPQQELPGTNTISVRVTTRDIVASLGNTLGLTFPRNASLALHDTVQYGIVTLVVDAKGASLTNVSQYFAFQAATNYVQKNSGSLSFATSMTTFELDLPREKFLLSGLSLRKYRFTGFKGKETFELDFSGAGEGILSNQFGLFSGRITGNAAHRMGTIAGAFRYGDTWLSGGTHELPPNIIP